MRKEILQPWSDPQDSGESKNRHPYLDLANLVLKTYIECRAYNISHRLFRTTDGEAILIYMWRELTNFSQKQVLYFGLPDTLSAYKRLFRSYDGFVDDSNHFPSWPEVKSDSQLRQAVNSMVTAVQDAPTPTATARLIIKRVNQQKYYQYNLHREYGAQAIPLSSAEAIAWREKSAGALTACFCDLANLQCQTPEREAIEAKESFYWLGATLQLIDDLVDISPDLRKGVQNSFRSCLMENHDELQALNRWFEKHGDHISYSRLHTITPTSIEPIETARASYFRKITSLTSSHSLHLMADPRNTAMIYAIYRGLSGFASDQNIWDKMKAFLTP